MIARVSNHIHLHNLANGRAIPLRILADLIGVHGDPYGAIAISGCDQAVNGCKAPATYSGVIMLSSRFSTLQLPPKLVVHTLVCALMVPAPGGRSSDELKQEQAPKLQSG